MKNGLYIHTNRKWAICSLPNQSCGPTKLKRTKGFVNLVNINDSSCNDRTMSIQRSSCFVNLWSSCSNRQSSAGGTACSRLPWPAVLPCRPHRPLLLPPLARPSLHSPTPPVILRRRQRSQTSEPSYPSPCRLPLSRLPWICIVPFLGLAVVHRRGALGAAWSMWSMTDFHRKSTVCGEAESRVHGRSKEVPPY